MSKKDNFCFLIHIIFLLSFILSIIFLNSVIDDSSENFLENEAFLEKYFREEKNITNITESTNLNENDIKKCNQIQSLVVSNNQSLDSLFELKTDTIHTLSIALKAFDVIMFFCVFFMCLSCPFRNQTDDKNCLSSFCMRLFDELCFNCIYIPFLILYTVCFVIQIILFSVLCGKYNYSDITNFLNFLECYNYYQEASEHYSIVNDYSYHIVLLKVFHSIYIVSCFIFIFLSFIINFCKDISFFEESNDKKDEKNLVNNIDTTQIILNN